MTLEEAMRNRHTVRRYTDRKLPQEILEQLQRRIQKNNQEYGLTMNLVTENTEAFGPALRLFLAFLHFKSILCLYDIRLVVTVTAVTVLVINLLIVLDSPLHINR